jgi:rubrerythrin
MSEMMKSLRGGADRAAFEAGKLMRLQRVQLEQRSHERERRDAVEQLGEATWRLYEQGRISEPELVGLCHAVQTATHEIAELEQAAAKVRSEQAGKPEQAATPTCPGCGHTVRSGAVFCPHCGRRQATAT